MDPCPNDIDSSRDFEIDLSEGSGGWFSKTKNTHRKFNSSPLKMDGWKTTQLLGG